MLKPMLLKLLIRSFGWSIGMFLVWFGLNQILDGSFWNGMTLSQSSIKVEYCEFNQVDKFFHQVMNTYSNLAYFFFGIFILHIAFEDKKGQNLSNSNRLQNFPLLSALVGICFIYLSFGSAFFHASLTYLGQRVDMNGTYGITIALVGLGFYHVFYKITLSKNQQRIWIWVSLLIIFLFLKIALLISSSTLLPALILINLILTTVNYIQFRSERHIGIAILSLILIIVAVKIRTLDVQKVDCNPHSLYQGHALWHLLTALSSFCTYSYFRFTKTV